MNFRTNSGVHSNLQEDGFDHPLLVTRMKILKVFQSANWKEFMQFVLLLLVSAVMIFTNSGCTIDRGELGTEKNPIKLFFIPSVDAMVIEDNSKAFKEFLEKNTPYKYTVKIPASYIAVVEAFGTAKADVAAMNSFGYILANQKFGAEAKLTVLRHGTATYQSQFLAHVDSGIKKLEDFKGRKMAFVDAASTSGYLLPMKNLKDKGIEPKETVFAFKHDNVVTMIYQKQVEGGATFYSPPLEGVIQDARRLVKTQFPDVEDKIKIVELSEPIPNDPIVFRKEMPEELKKSISDAFIKFVETKEGKEAFSKIYSVDGIKTATDADYDGLRKMIASVGKSAEELMAPKK